MIDLHTHILPGIDDGSKSLDIAERLLDSARTRGIDRIALTPHYYGKERSVEHFLNDRAHAFDLLRPRMPQGMSVKLGAEVYLDSVVSETKLAQLRIEDTDALLVELPYRGIWAERIYDRLDKLVRLGLTPIVAHIERYENARKKPAVVSKLLQLGCLVQANADSFLKKDRFCEALLEHGQIQIVASDAHDTEMRPIRTDEAFAQIQTKFGGETVRRLKEHAESVWYNRAVDVSGFTTVKKIFGFIG